MGSLARPKPNLNKSTFCVFVAFGFLAGILAFPAPPDDDHFLERECDNPAAHQLAAWLISEINKNYRTINARPPFMPLPSEKRNSELTSSIMGIPRTMVDNGR